MSHAWNDDSEELALYRESCTGLNPAAYRACVEALKHLIHWHDQLGEHDLQIAKHALTLAQETP